MKKIIITLLILIIIGLFPLVYSFDEAQLRRAQSNIERNLNSFNPTYTNVEVSTYFIKECDEDDTECEAENLRFRNDLTPKKSVLVNSIPNTPGFVPIDTHLYLYFGRDHSWNGIYRADVRGPNIQGRGTLKIYLGDDEELKNDALSLGVGGSRPLIYVLDSSLNVIEGQSIGVPPTLGEYRTSYVHTLNYTKPKEIFERARSLVESVSQVTDKDQLSQVLRQHNYSICQDFNDDDVQQLIFQIADCVKTQKQCYCQIPLTDSLNISQSPRLGVLEFEIDSKVQDVFYELEYKEEKEFGDVFDDIIYIFSNQTDKLVSKQEIDEDVEILIKEFEDILQPSNFLDGFFNIDLFSQIPFIDELTGFFSPIGLAGLGINMVVNQDFNIKQIIDIPGIDFAETLLNPEWHLDPENEEETIIEICTAPRVHHMVCDDLTELNFVIYLDSVE